MIKLVDDIYLDADDNCFMLKEWNGKTKVTDGNTYPVIQWTKYYQNYTNLLEAVFRILLRRDIQLSESLAELISLHTISAEKIIEIGNSIDSCHK